MKRTLNCDNLVISLFYGVIQNDNVVYQVQVIKRYKKWTYGDNIFI